MCLGLHGHCAWRECAGIHRVGQAGRQELYSCKDWQERRGRHARTCPDTESFQKDEQDAVQPETAQTQRTERSTGLLRCNGPCKRPSKRVRGKTVSSGKSRELAMIYKCWEATLNAAQWTSDEQVRLGSRLSSWLRKKRRARYGRRNQPHLGPTGWAGWACWALLGFAGRLSDWCRKRGLQEVFSAKLAARVTSIWMAREPRSAGDPATPGAPTLASAMVRPLQAAAE